jgi:hypothetical protein
MPLPPIPIVAHVQLMLASDRDYVCALVEGDDDSQFWHRWLIHQPLSRGGCTGVLDAVNDLQTAGLRNYFAIIDRDFNNTHHASPSVFVTKYRDRECDIINSSALEHFLTYFGVSGYQADQVRIHLKNALSFITILRLTFFEKRIEFPLDIHPENETYFNRSKCSLNETRSKTVCAAVFPGGSAALDVDVKKHTATITGNEWSFINGHDAVRALHFFCQNNSEIHRKQIAKPRLTLSHLELACSFSSMTDFSVWGEIEKLEDNLKTQIARRPKP